MKLVNKILFVLVAFIFIFSMTTNVFATDSSIVINSVSDDGTNTVQNSEGTTTLEVVEDTICTIEIEDLATFEKRLTNFNETEKSVTLTLTLTNNKTVEQTERDVEIFFVIDNSSSMTGEQGPIMFSSRNFLSNISFIFILLFPCVSI